MRRNKPQTDAPLLFYLLSAAVAFQVFWWTSVLGQICLHRQHIQCDRWDHHASNCWQTQHWQTVHQQVKYFFSWLWNGGTRHALFRTNTFHVSPLNAGNLCWFILLLFPLTIEGIHVTYLFNKDKTPPYILMRYALFYHDTILGTTFSLSGCMIVSMPKSFCPWKTTSSEWLCRPTSPPSWRRKMETTCPLRNWRSWPCSEEKNRVWTQAFLSFYCVKRDVQTGLHNGIWPTCHLNVFYISTTRQWL